MGDMSTQRLPRVFAMPSHDTLSVSPMRDFARKYIMKGGRSVDPFARNCRLADVTNDLNPATAATYHMDAEAFCVMLAERGELFDVAIFDPPYSPRQISECYQQVGRECSTTDTQAASWRKWRDALDKIVAPNGVVVSYGWNTNGMGKGRGYEIIDLLLVAHGGAHNDTICIAEKKAEVRTDLLSHPQPSEGGV
jgi:hypothetical protein